MKLPLILGVTILNFVGVTIVLQGINAKQVCAQSNTDVFSSSERNCDEDTSQYDRMYGSKPVLLTEAELRTDVCFPGPVHTATQLHNFCGNLSGSSCSQGRTALYNCWLSNEKIQQAIASQEYLSNQQVPASSPLQPNPSPRTPSSPLSPPRSDICYINPLSYSCMIERSKGQFKIPVLNITPTKQQLSRNLIAQKLSKQQQRYGFVDRLVGQGQVLWGNQKLVYEINLDPKHFGQAATGYSYNPGGNELLETGSNGSINWVGSQSKSPGVVGYSGQRITGNKFLVKEIWIDPDGSGSQKPQKYSYRETVQLTLKRVWNGSLFKRCLPRGSLLNQNQKN